MRHRPRLRRAIKWGMTCLAVALLMLWIASGRVFLFYAAANAISIGAAGGSLVVGWDRPTPLHTADQYAAIGLRSPYGWRVTTPDEWQFRWWQWAFRPILVVPLWALVLPLLIPITQAWRRDAIARRADPGLCPSCGYPRTGLATTTPCPECGNPSPS